MNPSKYFVCAALWATPVWSQADVENPAPTVEAAPVRLQFRPIMGETRRMRMSAQQKITQVRGPRKISMNQGVGLDFTFKVLGVDEKSATMRCTFDALRFTRTGDGITPINYDSRKPPKVVPDDAEGFDALVGGTVVLRFDTQMKLVQVQELDKMIEHMLNKMGIKPESRKFLRPLMEAAMGDAALKNLGTTLASFPGRDLKLGETWKKVDPVNGDWNLNYDGVCTLAKRENGVATIAIKSVVKPASNQKSLPFTGGQNGSFLVDENTGWTQRTELDGRFSTKMNVNGGFVSMKEKGFPLYVQMLLTLEQVNG
jgi:hypothetical protein